MRNSKNLFYFTFLISILFFSSCSDDSDEIEQIFEDNLQPSAPTLLTPENNATNLPTNIIKFSWTGSIDPEGENVYYQLYLGTENLPNDLLLVITDTSIVYEVFDTSDILKENQPYFWSVASVDKDGFAKQSDIFKFTPNFINNYPTSFSSLSPSDEFIYKDTILTLTWQKSSDPDDHEITYNLYLEANNEIPNVLQYSGKDTFFTFSADNRPLSNRTYFWYVETSDNFHASVVSDTLSFNLTPLGLKLGPVVLLSPKNEEKLFQPTFIWNENDSIGVTYKIYLDADNNFPFTTIASNLTIPFFEYDDSLLELNKQYYWQVLAIRGEDTVISEVRNFSKANVIETKANPQNWVKGQDFEEISLKGKTWMDRNLGANRAAQDSVDREAIGSYFQWGRKADGHEIVVINLDRETYYNSVTIKNGFEENLATSATNPSSNKFMLYSIDSVIYLGGFEGEIPGCNSSVIDEDVLNKLSWHTGPFTPNLWSGINAPNNPCPSGFRVPTKSELLDVINEPAFKKVNSGVFIFPNTPLFQSNAALYYTDESDIECTNTYYASLVMNFFSRTTEGNEFYRVPSRSAAQVRCIKE